MGRAGGPGACGATVVRTARLRLVRVQRTYGGAPAALRFWYVQHAGGWYAQPVRTEARGVRVSLEERSSARVNVLLPCPDSPTSMMRKLRPESCHSDCSCDVMRSESMRRTLIALRRQRKICAAELAGGVGAGGGFCVERMSGMDSLRITSHFGKFRQIFSADWWRDMYSSWSVLVITYMFIKPRQVRQQIAPAHGMLNT